MTEQEFATYLLRDVTGLVGEDETPSSAALANTIVVYRAAIATLAAKGFTIWNGSADTIPEEYVVPLGHYIGPLISKANGAIDAGTCISLQQVAEIDIRILASTPPTGAVLRVSYF